MYIGTSLSGIVITMPSPSVYIIKLCAIKYGKGLNL